jgi:hypothetical protein
MFLALEFLSSEKAKMERRFNGFNGYSQISWICNPLDLTGFTSIEPIDQYNQVSILSRVRFLLES